MTAMSTSTPVLKHYTCSRWHFHQTCYVLCDCRRATSASVPMQSEPVQGIQLSFSTIPSTSTGLSSFLAAQKKVVDALAAVY